ncbi:MAG: hypothetical protein KGQ66_19875 [Acidobacteriota bacterium]|nr:hypothetical protein [Acidobacteriota bacterium]
MALPEPDDPFGVDPDVDGPAWGAAPLPEEGPGRVGAWVLAETGEETPGPVVRLVAAGPPVPHADAVSATSATAAAVPNLMAATGHLLSLGLSGADAHGEGQV